MTEPAFRQAPSLACYVAAVLGTVLLFGVLDFWTLSGWRNPVDAACVFPLVLWDVGRQSLRPWVLLGLLELARGSWRPERKAVSSAIVVAFAATYSALVLATSVDEWTPLVSVLVAVTVGTVMLLLAFEFAFANERDECEQPPLGGSERRLAALRWVTPSVVVCAACAAFLWSSFRYGNRYLWISQILTDCLVAVTAVALRSLVPPLRRSHRWMRIVLGATMVVGAIVAWCVDSEIEAHFRAHSIFGTLAARSSSDVTPRAVSNAMSNSTRCEPSQSVEDVRARLRGVEVTTNPNLLLITIESARFDHVFGAPQSGSMPRLVHWGSSGGVVFSRAYSPSHQTLSSISSLMTGFLPSSLPLRAGKRPWQGELMGEARTAAEILREVGYETWAVVHNYRSVFGTTINGLEQGFVRAERVPDWDEASGRALDATIADRSIRMLEKSGPKPFFGWIFFGGPHHEYVRHSSSEGEEKSQHDLYVEELSNTDGQLGRVLDELARLGLNESTVVVVVADHGEEFGEHGGVGHLTLHRENVHVPLVVRAPGLAAGVVEEPFSATFVLPSILEHVRAAALHPGVQRMLAYRNELAGVLEGGVVAESISNERRAFALLDRSEHVLCWQANGGCEFSSLEERGASAWTSRARGSESRVASYWRFREAHRRYTIDLAGR